MARFHDCLASARAQAGDEALTASELDMLASMYDAQLRATRDELAAKAALAEELTAKAERKARLARLQAEKWEPIADRLENYRKPTITRGLVADPLGAAIGTLDNRNNRFVGTPSVTGRHAALIGEIHSSLDEFLAETDRTWLTGRRKGTDTLADMVDVAYGKPTDNLHARAFMNAWWKVNDMLVSRFNEAGGDIRPLKNYFPQNHSEERITAAGKEAWIAFIAPRLDIKAMRDPLSDAPLTQARLMESLDAIYDRITTNGFSDIEPSGAPIGRGALANQRQEHRFLVFKDGQAWRDYHETFGYGDVHRALMGHLYGLAKDIAVMDELGPNVMATLTMMKQAVRKLTNEDRGKRIDGVFAVVNQTVGVDSRFGADLSQAARNFTTGVDLAATAVTAGVTDPFLQNLARRYAGVPAAKYMLTMVQQMASESSKREIARAGIVMQDYMDYMTGLQGMRGMTAAAKMNEATKWLPDRVLTVTGLTPFTNAGRRAAAHDFMFMAADRMAQSLEEIAADGVAGRRFARQLRGQGISSADWDTIRAVRLDPVEGGEVAGGLLTPRAIMDSLPGDRARRELATRYSAAVHAFQEEATPMGTASIRALMGAATERGTVAGESVRMFFQYQTFAATTLSSLMRATMWELSEAGAARGVQFAASALLTLTLGGSALFIMREVLAGRDPPSVSDPKLYLMGLARGGGLGWYGDALLGDYKRGSTEQIARLAGPVPGRVFDLVAVASPHAFVTEDEVNRGKRAVQFAKRNTPLLNMWPWRMASERILWDRLELMADPNAHRAWRRKEREMMREHGQGTWWGRGESEPRRAPDFLTMGPW